MSTLNVTQIKNPSAGSAAITLDAAGNAAAPSLVPPGTVQFYAANTAPAGWVKANGALISRSTYADLFAAIGTAFGVGDGSTTFALPDLRGEFPRGWDDGRGVDSGRAFGGEQADEFKSHNHPATHYQQLAGGSSANTYVKMDGAMTNRTWIGNAGGTETRPRNIALLAIIKY
jgi:microcystin-dependent protein